MNSPVPKVMTSHALDQANIDQFISIRRDIHQHPELGLEEHRTSELVATLLKEWGYEVETNIANTGVVGQLVNHPNGKPSGRTLGIRADLDALPIHEQNHFAYASKNTGVMHACGHDGHTAMLLAAAKQIAERKAFDGTLNLIFQPAEECVPGGASLMIKEGLFDKYPCDAIFGMHNMPGYPQGHLVFREGAMLASCDNVDIKLSGVGGHGAMPHYATDSIVAASSIIMALQTIVARNIDPRLGAVVTVGAIHSGEANNVIPDTAEMKLSVRALDPQVRDQLEDRIRTIVETQAASYNVKAEIDYQRGFPVLVNSAAETSFARKVGLELAGDHCVVENGEPLMGSEDFAYFLEEIPGCYLFIGNGDGENACMVHNPKFDFNDDNIAIGAAYWSLLAERFLTGE